MARFKESAGLIVRSGLKVIPEMLAPWNRQKNCRKQVQRRGAGEEDGVVPHVGVEAVRRDRRCGGIDIENLAVLDRLQRGVVCGAAALPVRDSAEPSFALENVLQSRSDVQVAPRHHRHTKTHENVPIEEHVARNVQIRAVVAVVARCGLRRGERQGERHWGGGSYRVLGPSQVLVAEIGESD